MVVDTATIYISRIPNQLLDLTQDILSPPNTATCTDSTPLQYYCHIYMYMTLCVPLYVYVCMYIYCMCKNWWVRNVWVGVVGSLW